MLSMKLSPIFSLFAVIGCFGCLLVSCAGQNAGLAAYRKGDYVSAVREYGREDSPSSNFAIGVMHYKGQGVPRDMKKAALYFRKAAEEGT